MTARVRIIDTTLRDGSHAVSHQFTPRDMAEIARGLDRARMETVIIGHGDGQGGSSIQYGRAAASDSQWLKAVSKVLTRTQLGVLLLPGIGTVKDLEVALENGAKVVQIATHCTEADISEQHMRWSKGKGLEVIGFLMMAHMEPVEVLLGQARLMESYGADIVYITDSAGAMLPGDVKEKVTAFVSELSCKVGFHAHNNLGLAVGNTLTAIEAGASVTDSCLRGLGAGAGNTQTEVLVHALDRLGIETGIDLDAILEVAEKVLEPLMRRPQVIDNASIVLGYAGVYSSFLLHTYRQAKRFNVNPREVLIELGRRKTVGGQEDLIIDVAAEFARRRDAGESTP